jgi:NADH:ubiquinone reductase (H+-translocating)
MASGPAIEQAAPSPRHRIVVVGGGAAGLELVTRLGDKLGRHGKAAITLVERARTHLWKPLLHAVAAGSMDPAEHELNYLAQAHWHHFQYRYGEMTGIDRVAKEVRLAATYDEEGRQITPARSIPYDTLVVAIGSVTNDFGTPGVAEYAVPLDTPRQAVRFNHRLVNACIRANSQPEAVRPGQLHVAIIGAGATGTELAAELHHTIRQLVAYGLDRIAESDIRIILIEAADRILPALSPRISAASAQLLGKLGVEIRTGAKVSEVHSDGVVLADGSVIPSELVVWSAGVKAPDVLRDIGGLETNRINQLVVLPTLQTTRDPDIFAMGDCAACPRPGFDAPVPPRAQAAHQQASHLFNQIAGRLADQAPTPFVYRDFGSLVSLGHNSTVGNLMGFLHTRSLFIEGFFARMMYRSLYKMHEKAVYGSGRLVSNTLARLLTRYGVPTVKLH